jgi:hypothetical protein
MRRAARSSSHFLPPPLDASTPGEKICLSVSRGELKPTQGGSFFSVVRKENEENGPACCSQATFSEL